MEAVQAIVKTPTPTSPPDPSGNARLLAGVIQEQADALLRTLCVYVHRAGLGVGAEARRVAQDLLSELVVQALRHADRFDPSRQPMAWLLGIANNMILREKQRRRRQAFREPFLQDLVAEDSPSAEEALVGRLLAACRERHHADALASRDQYEKMLSHVSEQDQRLIHMSVIQQMTAQEIGARLELTAGAVRVRLHRALKRLRKALEQGGRDELLAR